MFGWRKAATREMQALSLRCNDTDLKLIHITRQLEYQSEALKFCQAKLERLTDQFPEVSRHISNVNHSVDLLVESATAKQEKLRHEVVEDAKNLTKFVTGLLVWSHEVNDWLKTHISSEYSIEPPRRHDSTVVLESK